MNATSPKRFFEALAIKANRSTEGVRIMRGWVGRYDGKIVQFETDTEKFYLVIADSRMRVHEGEYPSPDLIVRGASKVISDAFTGRRSVSDAMKNWELVLVGSGNEGFALGRLIMTVMMEA